MGGKGCLNVRLLAQRAVGALLFNQRLNLRGEKRKRKNDSIIYKRDTKSSICDSIGRRVQSAIPLPVGITVISILS